MCGIGGINSSRAAIEKSLEILYKLEYRGYDSTGISTIMGGALRTIKVVDKVEHLDKEIAKTKLQGNISIGHTRWATHGVPSIVNAHPHSTDKVSIVHNGIIENCAELKEQLLKEQIKFSSDTDTEVILHLIEKYLKLENSPYDAARKSLSMLEGSFAILAIFADYPDVILAAKKDSPLIVGYGDEENFVSSDAYSITKFTNRLSYLEDGDIAMIYNDKVEIVDQSGNNVIRKTVKIAQQDLDADKGAFEHYMHKEIHQQPVTTKHSLSQYICSDTLKVKIPIDFSNINKIIIIACGSSYFAGLTAKYWLEEIANIPVTIEISSEYQANIKEASDQTIAVFISQSGETADTIAALREFKRNNALAKTASIVNVVESTIARETNVVLPIYAGQEIGVASTKAFVNQLMVFSYLAIKAASDKNSIDTDAAKSKLTSLFEIPGRIAEILSHEQAYKQIANLIYKSTSTLYTGKRALHAIALEGALKLKEISYIHAEALAAGELKHGSIALIDENMPVIALLNDDNTFDKNISNIKSIIARKGRIILLSNKRGCDLLKDECVSTVTISKVSKFIAPILYTIPLQLIAYHAAILRGTNVDQPRNLCKAVTVE